MKSRIWLLPSAAIALATLLTAPAQAATWDFTFTSSDNLVSGSGSFITSGSANPAELVTSITGSYTNSIGTYSIVSIAALTNTTANLYFDYDNLFSSVAPYFSENGLVFIGSDGIYYDLFYDGLAYELIGNESYQYEPVISLTITQEADTTPPTSVPEPSSLALMLAAGGLLAAARRRRQR